ncbi:MAG: hypothetical protein LBS82_00985 [Spirochaetaceae bacterium]|jgi:hypothetical protein|nr:hypothetical protein [Spirochaetaceae bacterium]
MAKKRLFFRMLGMALAFGFMVVCASCSTTYWSTKDTDKTVIASYKTPDTQAFTRAQLWVTTEFENVSIVINDNSTGVLTGTYSNGKFRIVVKNGQATLTLTYRYPWYYAADSHDEAERYFDKRIEANMAKPLNSFQEFFKD